MLGPRFVLLAAVILVLGVGPAVASADAGEGAAHAAPAAAEPAPVLDTARASAATAPEPAGAPGPGVRSELSSLAPTPAPSPTPTPAPTPTATPEPTPTPTPTATPAPSPTAPITYRITSFMIVDLPAGKRPYDDLATPDLGVTPAVADANGIPMRQVGSKKVYGPVTVAQWALGMMAGYERTGDVAYLHRAQAAADVFRSIGVWSGPALYLPYRFDFALHGKASDTLRSPWYSAMAQGQALSLMVRIYRATGDPADLGMARALFLSLLHKGRGTAPWVSYVDASRNLWLEEYAEHDPEHTLNGMIFAIYGLYDYYTLTHDANAYNMLRGALTTIRLNVARFRNPGTVSSYCLKYPVRSLKYHHIHVAQLIELTAMTRVTYFASLATALRHDAW